MIIKFEDFYNDFGIKNIVDKINGGSKNSKLSPSDVSTINNVLNLSGKSQMKGFCIITPEGKSTENSAQQAFVDLTKFICKNDESFEKMKLAEWFYSSKDLSNISNITKRYGNIREDCYIYKDAEVTLLMARSVKLLLDCGRESELALFSFSFDVKVESSSEQNDMDDDQWWPTIDEYDPGITKEQWLEMLNDGSTFTANAYFAIAAMYDFGGIATCRQLEEKYGKTSDFYRSALGTQLASKVKKKYDLPYCMNGEENSRVWPIVFQGRDAKAGEPGNYVWKIRHELEDALEEFDILKFLQKEEGEKLPVKDTLEYIKQYIDSEGFSYDSNLIENFYLSLKAKPFVLLAGTSGTGKTRLARLFAKAIGAYDDNRYLQVAVKPDWSDSTDLFGHVNLENEFVPGAVIEFIKKAAEDRNNLPYILCMDEMNLARVEYYLSDFLSVIETRDWSGKAIKTDKLVPKVCYSGNDKATKLYQDLILPENLYIIGTVNMDETTFPFSKKVLDRANTIEFSYVDFKLSDLEENENVEPVKVDNVFLRADFLRLKKDCKNQWETVLKVNDKLTTINEILKSGDAHFGYRMRDEIIFYMLYREQYDLLTEKEAFDNQIMQKILPRIQGSSEAIAELLRNLFKECAGPYANKSGSSDSHKMENYIKDGGNATYPKSAEKIWKMLRRFEDDDFTSYWV